MVTRYVVFLLGITNGLALLDHIRYLCATEHGRSITTNLLQNRRGCQGCDFSHSMKNNRQNLVTAYFLRRGANKNINPYRANCDARQSANKGVRDRFSDDIQGAVDIGVNEPSVSRLKQAAIEAATQIFGLMADLLKVKKRAFGSVALVLNDDLEADQPGLVTDQLNQLGVGNRDKLLVVDPPDLDCLFPPFVIANHQRPDALTDQLVNHQAAGLVQVILDPPVATVSDGSEPAGVILTCRQVALQLCSGFVVELVQRLQGASVNNERLEAGFV